ncbi:MAG: TetR/AcrR family transcriptional regulator [Bacteroidetes bacterium]|nr:TetR/AcrR family transcriptional regulator [Bacteroidota bacterium]
MELVKKIAHAADTLFSRFGVRSVSMDDVAREISISKKTLYKCFRDKNDLVRCTIEMHMQEVDTQINRILETEQHPIRQIALIGELIVNTNGNLNPSLIYDLRKYHSDCYHLLMDHRDNQTLESVKQNIQKGMALGLYRPDLDLNLVSRFYVFLVLSAFDPMQMRLENVRFDAVLKELMRYHMHGICSPLGLHELELIPWFQTKTES